MRDGPFLVEASAGINTAENHATSFLQNLQAAVGNDAEAESIIREFNASFSAMHLGHCTAHDTRIRSRNLLTDTAPTMVEEFDDSFPTCSHTNAWAGFARGPNSARGPNRTSHLSAASEPPSAKRRSVTNQISIGGAASAAAAGDPGANEVEGTAAGAQDGAKDWKNVGKSLVPYGRGSYAIWFTVANISLIIGLFAYMAGDYAMYVRLNPEGFSNTRYETIVEDSGKVPDFMLSWLGWQATWQSFEFDFLRLWGGRWGPGLTDGRWWLWFTSIYIHRDLQHIVSNLLLFVAMSVHLELNYGWWRLLLVWVASGVGANLISATFENVCTLLVGASGAVFGFMGLFVADLIINFESISWPFMRVITILLFVIFFVANALADNSSTGNVSHASHIGGLICGLFPSMLFLPNLRDKRLAAVERQLQEQADQNADAPQRTDSELHNLKASFWSRKFPVNPLRILGVLVVAAVYVFLPIYLYTSRLDFDPDTRCEQGGSSSNTSDARRMLLEEDFGRFPNVVLRG